MNYPLHNENKKHPEILTPIHSSYSDEYAERMCDLYLSDHIERNEQGELQEYYRLHARDWHTPEMALVFLQLSYCHARHNPPDGIKNSRCHFWRDLRHIRGTEPVGSTPSRFPASQPISMPP